MNLADELKKTAEKAVVGNTNSFIFDTVQQMKKSAAKGSTSFYAFPRHSVETEKVIEYFHKEGIMCELVKNSSAFKLWLI